MRVLSSKRFLFCLLCFQSHLKLYFFLLTCLGHSCFSDMHSILLYFISLHSALFKLLSGLQHLNLSFYFIIINLFDVVALFAITVFLVILRFLGLFFRKLFTKLCIEFVCLLLFFNIFSIFLLLFFSFPRLFLSIQYMLQSMLFEI